MRKHGMRAALGGSMVAAALFAASGASAATLTGDYQFQGTRASSAAGPALTDIGAGNAFRSETVMGATRQVLAFPQGNGLQMQPAGLGLLASPYSVVMTFRLGNVSGDGEYARILDGSEGGSDDGVYSHDGKIDYYASGDNESTSPVLANNVYATVAMVARGGLQGLNLYVNGTHQASYEGYPGVTNEDLRFFKDNGSEESAGAVSCIRVYDDALTPEEVSGIGASPDCIAHPSQVAPPTVKKCKKHKRRHRSAQSAKKKKCKKRKKRIG
jgi:hypothetical protein